MNRLLLSQSSGKSKRPGGLVLNQISALSLQIHIRNFSGHQLPSLLEKEFELFSVSQYLTNSLRFWFWCQAFTNTQHLTAENMKIGSNFICIILIRMIFVLLFALLTISSKTFWQFNQYQFPLAIPSLHPVHLSSTYHILCSYASIA